MPQYDKNFYKNEYPKLTKSEKIAHWDAYCYHLIRTDISAENPEDVFTTQVYEKWKECDANIDDILDELMDKLEGLGLDKELMYKNLGIKQTD
jgi:hypothetical protein